MLKFAPKNLAKWVWAPQVPCGRCFHQELQWVAAPAGDGRARLVVSARVAFTGPVYGMRGLIESSSLEARPCAEMPGES